MNIKNILTTILYFSSIFTSSAKRNSSPKKTPSAEDFFDPERGGLTIVSHDTEKRKFAEQPEYSMGKCEEMRKAEERIFAFYSYDCTKLSTAKTEFFQIDQRTLDELITSATKYWLGEKESDKYNYKLVAAKPSDNSTNIMVCAVSNIPGSPASANTLTKKELFRLKATEIANNKDGSHKNIKISLQDIPKSEIRHNKDKSIGFEMDGIITSSKTGLQLRIIDLFVHEIGHIVFGLAHPKNMMEIDSIMLPGKRVEQEIKHFDRRTEEDRHFTEICLRKDDKKVKSKTCATRLVDQDSKDSRGV